MDEKIKYKNNFIYLSILLIISIVMVINIVQQTDATGYIIKKNNKSTPSSITFIDVLLNPVFYVDPSLTQTFPIGQMFDLDVLFYDDQGIGINNVKLKVSLNKKILATITLPCETQGDLIVCGDRTWNAVKVPIGTNVYSIEVIGKDNIGNYITNNKNFTLTFNEVNKSLCKELVPKYNKNTPRMINVVFIGFGYNNIEDLKFVASSIIDLDRKNYGLLSIEPFKKNKNKFNFWYIDKILPLPAECVPTSEGCAMNFSLAVNCHYGNKYIVGLGNGIFTSESGGRLSTISLPFSLEVPLDKIQAGKLFVHEFGGHAFGELADEYVVYPDEQSEDETDTSIFVIHKNCYTGSQHTKEECLQNAPWKDFIGSGCGKNKVIDCKEGDKNYNLEIGCFEGCNKVGLGIFRPTMNSIMNSVDILPYSFGMYNEKLIKDEFLFNQQNG